MPTDLIPQEWEDSFCDLFDITKISLLQLREVLEQYPVSSTVHRLFAFSHYSTIRIHPSCMHSEHNVAADRRDDKIMENRRDGNRKVV